MESKTLVTQSWAGQVKMAIIIKSSKFHKLFLTEQNRTQWPCPTHKFITIQTKRDNPPIRPYLTVTISSIFKIILTHSHASEMALVLTSNGCTTFSSRMFVIWPFLTLMPVFFSPLA